MCKTSKTLNYDLSIWFDHIKIFCFNISHSQNTLIWLFAIALRILSKVPAFSSNLNVFLKLIVFAPSACSSSEYVKQ